MPQPDYTIRQNDSGEAITAVLVDAAGDPVNLTDATVVFQLAPIGGGALVVSAAADIGEDDGAVSYTWLDGDTATAGWYMTSWRVTFDGGVVQSFPLTTYTLVQIIGELGAIPGASAPGSGLALPDWWTVDNVAKIVEFLGRLVVTPGEDQTITFEFNYSNGDAFLAGGDDNGGAVLFLRSGYTFRFGDSPAGAYVVQVSDGHDGDIIWITPNDDENTGVRAWGLKQGGAEYLFALTDTPADVDVETSQRVQWYEDTAGAPKQRVKERDANGVLYERISATLLADGTAFAGVTKPNLPTNPTNAQIAAVFAALGLVNLT